MIPVVILDDTCTKAKKGETTLLYSFDEIISLGDKVDKKNTLVNAKMLKNLKIVGFVESDRSTADLMDFVYVEKEDIEEC